MSATLAAIQAAADPIAQRFQRDTAEHQMIPARDEGLYRHLKFRRYAPWTGRDGVAHPPSLHSPYWFDILTWPGHLTITGDCGTYTFARIPDMFQFFRQPRGAVINPDYWSEKVCGDVRLTRYSPEKFERDVRDCAAEAEDYWCGLTAHIEKHIFGPLAEWDTEYEEGAREALRDFTFGDFRFQDTWEWDLHDFDWQFLWCCHAIVWAIAVYDRSKAGAA